MVLVLRRHPTVSYRLRQFFLRYGGIDLLLFFFRFKDIVVGISDVVSDNTHNPVLYKIFTFIRLQCCVYVLAYTTGCKAVVKGSHVSQHLQVSFALEKGFSPSFYIVAGGVLIC